MKKARTKRPRLTHVEVRRGEALRLRVSISEDALVEGAGDELGLLIRKVAPTAPVAMPMSVPPEVDVTPDHAVDDNEFHAGMRARLAELFGSLCDAALDDALALGRAEQARRADGMN